MGIRTLPERRAINAALNRALTAADAGHAYERDVAVIELVKLLGAADVLRFEALQLGWLERRQPVAIF